VNSIYRGKLNLLFDLSKCYYTLQSIFSNIKLSSKLPQQLILRFGDCTLLLFNSGQFRIMGRAALDKALVHLESIHSIYSDIITALHLVSQTFVFQIDIAMCPINLHYIAKYYTHDINVRFECELFPALTLHYWRPVHINVFSNGKVVVLGKDSEKYLTEIEDWINNTILLLPAV